MNRNKIGTKLKTRELVTLSMLGAIMFAAKEAMAMLPNIEPVSLLIVIYTVFWGRKALYPIFLYVLLEMLLRGMGLWFINYLYIWAVLWAVAYLLGKMRSPVGWAVVTGTFGLLFGALCTPVYFAAGGWAYALSWWLAGIQFDLMHCAGNFTLTLVLFKPCCAIIEKVKK